MQSNQICYVVAWPQNGNGILISMSYVVQSLGTTMRSLWTIVEWHQLRKYFSTSAECSYYRNGYAAISVFSDQFMTVIIILEADKLATDTITLLQPRKKVINSHCQMIVQLDVSVAIN